MEGFTSLPQTSPGASHGRLLRLNGGELDEEDLMEQITVGFLKGGLPAGEERESYSRGQMPGGGWSRQWQQMEDWIC